MEGDLREFPLAEILQFISLGSRTGMLEIVRGDGISRINFTAGAISGLTADTWSLTAELRVSGLISATAVADLPAAGSAEELRSAVLTGGHMTAEEWTAFVARQVERLLFPLFDAREGTFRFRQAYEHPGPWLPTRITADRAVLEGTRWSEAWARSRQVIPSDQTRFVRRPNPPARPRRVSVSHWRVYVALGEPGTVAQVATRAILTEVEVAEAIEGLLGQELIVRTQDQTESE